ncbi:MAG: hypothetical protein ACXW2W_11240 [Telluria sp.]
MERTAKTDSRSDGLRKRSAQPKKVKVGSNGQEKLIADTQIHAYIDVISNRAVSGWTASFADYTKRLRVQLLIDGIVVAESTADQYRSDVKEVSVGDGRYGFEFTGLPAHLHSADQISILVEGAYVCIPSSQTNVQLAGLGQGTLDRQEDGEARSTSAFHSVFNGELSSLVDPFLSLDLSNIRSKLVGGNLLGQAKESTRTALTQPGSPQFYEDLVALVAEMKVEIHYLKTALIQAEQYKDPAFVTRTPELPVMPTREVLEINLCGEITGSNWSEPKPAGRWLMLGTTASVLVPAMDSGMYSITIEVVEEAFVESARALRCSVNKQEIELQPTCNGVSTVLEATIIIPNSYRFPFWALKLSCDSPLPAGSADDNHGRHAMLIRSIGFKKVR